MRDGADLRAAALIAFTRNTIGDLKMASVARAALGWLSVISVMDGIALGDGPGMLLYNTAPPGYIVERAPFQRYLRIGHLAAVPNSTTGAPFTGVLADGSPIVHANAPSALLAIPSSLTSVRDIGATMGFVVAIDASGFARAWGTTPPAWLPSEPLIDLDVSFTAAGAITESGTLALWNTSAELASTPVITNARTLSLSIGWGVVVSASGETTAFGYGGTSAPSIATMASVREVSVCGGTSRRSAVIRTDGSLGSLESPFNVAGDFVKVAVNPTRLYALNAQGTIRYWTWDATALSWSAVFVELTGVHDDVATPKNGGGNSLYAVCASDTDRNGVDDFQQIVNGEITDVNGDLIDDATQSMTVLSDEDLNGAIDAAEVAAIAGRFGELTEIWFFGGPVEGSRIGFFALDRVSTQAEAVTTLHLKYAGSEFGAQGVPAEGLPTSYGIWLDPNHDGNASDAVEIGRWDVLLEPDGVMTVDLGAVWIGPPGTSFFHGLSYDDVVGNGAPAVFPAMSTPTLATDFFGASRKRGRCLAGYVTPGELPMSPLAFLKAALVFEEWGRPGILPMFALTWGERRAGDCDEDGLLDSTVVGASNDPWWGDDFDLDDNGIIDTCEVDCDGNGVFDVVEILAGASDCNLDLIPDSCAEQGVSEEQTGAVPSASEPTLFDFGALPIALSPVTIHVEAVADLGAPTEALLFRLGDGIDQALFVAAGSDCPTQPDAVILDYTAEDFEAHRVNGAVHIRVGATSLVDPAQCVDGFVRVTINFALTVNDCDSNGVDDGCQHGFAQDFDGNGIPDACDLDSPRNDSDGNGVLDACERDCNRNGTLDVIEFTADPSLDCDGSGFLDACEFIDCNENGLFDPCEPIDSSNDCNGDGIMDACQTLADCDGDGEPNACEADCDGNGTPNACEILNGAVDKDTDGVPDACEYARGDFDLDGIVGATDLAYILSVWGLPGISVGDLNGDGLIGGQDLSIMLDAWGVLTY